MIRDKVVGLCQQYLDHNPLISTILDVYGSELIPMVQTMWDEMRQKTDSGSTDPSGIKYKCGATLDLWFTIDEVISCNLIEINTSGLWTAAGSGLFTWAELIELYETGETKILYY